MSGFVDLERVAVRADRALARLDTAQTAEIERYLTVALRRTLDQTGPLYARALSDVDGAASNAAFRLARARVLADEIDGTLRGFMGTPSPALEGLLARVTIAREEARGFVEDSLRVFGDAVTISTPVNHRALSGVVENAARRLYRHGDDVVDRIKTDVASGLVRGDSWAQVTRSIRDNTGYLRSRAEMIAITELHSAQADARQELYADLGVQLVIRYVTIDDRTCEYCGPRQGEVTEAAKTTEVLHPRCRCLLAPFDPEWALDDTLVPEQLEEMLAENLRELEALGLRPNLNAAPFERVRDRFMVRAGPQGLGRPPIVWRPGQPTSRLVPWLGRSFTNLGAFATDPIAPIAGVAQAAAAVAPTADDVIVQARELPKRIRGQIAALDDEAKAIRARVAAERAKLVELEAELEKLKAKRVAASQSYWRLREEQRELGYRVQRERSRLIQQNPDLRASSSAQLDAILRQQIPDLFDEAARLERAVQAADAAQRNAQLLVNAAYDRVAEVRVIVERADRDARLFIRTRSHELLRNSSTGHQNGSAPIATRMRDATLKKRLEDAETWLREHTTLTIDRPTNANRLKKGARAYQLGGEINIAPEDGVRVIVHEMGHAIDRAHPSLVAREIAWRDGRTVGERWQRLSLLTGNPRYKPHEVAKPDRFLEPYIGKDYGSRSTEILSMGLELMYAEPYRLATADPDMFDLILRLMKGLPDP